MVVGLKVTELALPSPEAERVIGESKPPVVVVVMVTSPEALRAMVMEVGFALMENPAVVLVTVSETE
jgi:hypothetical protein